MGLLESFLKYFVQPLLWAGVIAVVLQYSARVRYERKTFRIAVNRDFYEGRHFLKHAAGWFLVAAVITFLLGVTVPERTIWLYQVLGVIALLFCRRADLSLEALLVTGALTLLGSQSGVHSTLLPANLSRTFSASVLVIAAMCAGFQVMLAGENRTEWFAPRIREGRRGRRIVGYYFNEMTVLPLVLFLPSSDGTQTAFLWPFSGGSGMHFTVVFAPLLVMAGTRVFKRSLKAGLAYYRRMRAVQCGLCAVSAMIAFLVPQAGLPLMLLLLVVGGFLAFRCRKFDEKGGFWYVETGDGARVVAVKAGTPAARMRLVPGDVILECNKVHVRNAEELYQALQMNSAYCHLLVRTIDDELKICESALYADAPHEIGIILFD